MSKRKNNRILICSLAQYQQNLCFHCGKQMILPDLSRESFENFEMNEPDQASIEHMLPKSLDGQDTISNIVIAHRQCNSVRGMKEPDREELLRLAKLNLLRTDILGIRSGLVDDSTFGIQNPALSNLIDMLNTDTSSGKKRNKKWVCKRLSEYQLNLNALNRIENHRSFVKFAGLLHTDAVESTKSTRSEVPEKHLSHLRTVFTTLFRQAIVQRTLVYKKSLSIAASERAKAHAEWKKEQNKIS